MLVPWSSCAGREIASLRSRCRSSRLVGGKESVSFWWQSDFAKLDNRDQVFEVVFKAPFQLGIEYSSCRVSRLDRWLFRLLLDLLALARPRPAVLQWHSQPVFQLSW